MLVRESIHGLVEKHPVDKLQKFRVESKRICISNKPVVSHFCHDLENLHILSTFFAVNI